MAVKTCGQCADGWVCEIHPDEPWTHHVDLAVPCGVAMACTNSACRLSWANERHPDGGLIRPPVGPWRPKNRVLLHG
jgi:hypothetical protein